jgi:16S rRNA processing protein RimM
MIRKSEVYPIGRLIKPHGIHGEVGFAFTSDVFDQNPSPYWIFEMDGILIPFFVETCRFKSNDIALVKFEGIDSDAAIRAFSGKEVYYPISHRIDEETDPDDWNFYLGFQVYDEAKGYLGEVTEVDDSTLNILFSIRNGEQELLMPVAEEYLLDVNVEKRELRVSLPEGLFDL